MQKFLAETKGRFQLYDMTTGFMVASHRPSVVLMSTFIQDRIGREQVRVLGELNADATDDDFKETWKEAEGDRQLAIDSFLSEFGVDVVEDDDDDAAEKQTVKRRGKAKLAKPTEPVTPPVVPPTSTGGEA